MRVKDMHAVMDNQPNPQTMGITLTAGDSDEMMSAAIRFWDRGAIASTPVRP